MAVQEFRGQCFVNGIAAAELLWSDVGLSFWGGVDTRTGLVQDRHHPLYGSSISGRVLAIPSGRGSCTGSTVMLELLLSGCAPAAVVFEKAEYILTLGVIVARTLFDLSIPVVMLSTDDYQSLRSRKFAAVKGQYVYAGEDTLPQVVDSPPLLADPGYESVELSSSDQEILSGKRGKGAQTALQVVLHMAALQNAITLLDVTQAHIDACIYTGPGALQFAQAFLSVKAKFVVPTTLNAISIDKRRWKEIGMYPEQSSQAEALADTYLDMGAQPSFTCAPYALDTAPKAGENTGWAESNAVVFANSALGARTQKYPDFMDVCIALTGRAPLAGCHLAEGRCPAICIEVGRLEKINDLSWPVLGYAVGKLSQSLIPIVYGLEHLKPSMTDLKAFSAAFGTMSSAPMFHMTGITPEASQHDSLAKTLPISQLTQSDFDSCLLALNTAPDPSLQLISLGSPHFLLEEFRQLAELCDGKYKSPSVDFFVTTARQIHDKAVAAGYTDSMDEFGVSIITDTCWCMLGDPVIKPNVVNIMTNSAKYAHYGPALVNRGIHFGSLAQCVEAACTGQFSEVLEHRARLHSIDQ